ncbi:PTS mannose transporter subunit IIC, partial [Lactobacillus sp. XV13L]|nr:PTS mannose transporter subunit IIC [Lactobacillus sp. XV13L]
KGLTRLHFGMWFLNYFIFSLATFFAVLAGARPVQHLVAQIPANLMAGLAATGGLLPAVGFAILMRMLWSKQLSPYYFLGFILAAYLNLPSVAVAGIGIIIVALQWIQDKKIMDLENKQANMATTSSTQAIDNGSEAAEAQEEEDFFS